MGDLIKTRCKLEPAGGLLTRMAAIGKGRGMEDEFGWELAGHLKYKSGWGGDRVNFISS